MPHARVPDFFIVGNPKSGTTALYEMLRGHPQIHMPVKETWFFAPDQIRKFARGQIFLADLDSLYSSGQRARDGFQQ